MSQDKDKTLLKRSTRIAQQKRKTLEKGSGKPNDEGQATTPESMPKKMRAKKGQTAKPKPEKSGSGKRTKKKLEQMRQEDRKGKGVATGKQAAKLDQESRDTKQILRQSKKKGRTETITLSESQKLKRNPEAIPASNRERLSEERELRRVDSLARLLEAGGMCAAVCLVDNEIVVTNNKVFANIKQQFPDNKTVEFIQKVLAYFQKKGQDKRKKEDTKEVIDILEQICKKKISLLIKRNAELELRFAIDDETWKKIITNLYDDKTSQAFMEKDLNFFRNFLPETERSNYTKLVAVQFYFDNIWRLVRDFKKARNFCEGQEIRDFKLLAVGIKDEHAEVRLISYLLETGKFFALREQEVKEKESSAKDKEKIIEERREGAKEQEEEQKDEQKNNSSYFFIGISKLCCANCAFFIKELNNHLKNKLAFEFVDDKEQENIAKDAGLEKMTEKGSVESHLIVSGKHGLPFSWVRPSYLKEEEKVITYYLDQHHTGVWSAASQEWFDLLLDEKAKGTLENFYRKFSEEYNQHFKLHQQSEVGTSTQGESRSMGTSPSDSAASSASGSSAVSLSASPMKGSKPKPKRLEARLVQQVSEKLTSSIKKQTEEGPSEPSYRQK